LLICRSSYGTIVEKHRRGALHCAYRLDRKARPMAAFVPHRSAQTQKLLTAYFTRIFYDSVSHRSLFMASDSIFNSLL